METPSPGVGRVNIHRYWQRVTGVPGSLMASAEALEEEADIISIIGGKDQAETMRSRAHEMRTEARQIRGYR